MGAKVDACEKIKPKASAYATSIATPSSSTSTGTTLPERAEAAYITELGKYSKTAEDLLTSVAAPIKSGEDGSSADNRTVFHRTIIVSVRKEGGFNPEDRLEATDVVIRPHGARFDSWDTLATAYTTINAGTVQLTQARGATENLTVGAPTGAPISGSLSFGGSQTDTRVENISALNQVESVTASVEENGTLLRIHRQGGYGIDLTGNSIIKADMTYTGNPPDASNPVFSYLFSRPKTYKNGKPLPLAKVELASKPVFAPQPGTEVQADIYLTYTMRHVVSGGKTYEEKDDTIADETFGPIWKTVTLIPAREASPPAFGLHIISGPNKDFVVEVQADGRNATGLCFASYTDALDFLAYWNQVQLVKSGRLKNAQLGVYRPDHTDPTAHFVPLTKRDVFEVCQKCF